MKAQYFYDRLLGYGEESYKTGMWYYGYSNNNVDIHRKNDKDIYYTIYNNREVHKCSINSYKIYKMNIEDLQGDDFELYNTIQMLKTGYILLEDIKDETNVKRVITNLHNYIESFDDSYDMSIEPIPVTCGCCYFENGLTDTFAFYATNGIEIDIYAIRRLVKENQYRRHYNARVMPFNKHMDDNNSFYVTFTENISCKSMQDIYDRCDTALVELCEYLNELNIKYKWVDMNIKYPIYH